jgi:hypothetical protein
MKLPNLKDLKDLNRIETRLSLIMEITGHAD